MKRASWEDVDSVDSEDSENYETEEVQEFKKIKRDMDNMGEQLSSLQKDSDTFSQKLDDCMDNVHRVGDSLAEVSRRLADCFELAERLGAFCDEDDYWSDAPRHA
eukprot:Phypoly_transcript_24656.p1 GENE.Phypoly_transcript_24656~~Phypoly_transcript_24656.p1  ORF type:complete len:116 (-),score=15.96 Phypoly_transcript_24656:195-509(-)